MEEGEEGEREKKEKNVRSGAAANKTKLTNSVLTSSKRVDKGSLSRRTAGALIPTTRLAKTMALSNAVTVFQGPARRRSSDRILTLSMFPSGKNAVCGCGMPKCKPVSPFRLHCIALVYFCLSYFESHSPPFFPCFEREKLRPRRPGESSFRDLTCRRTLRSRALST